MRKILFVLVIMIFLLSACGQSTPVPVVDDVTPTPALTLTSTATLLPSATPTASITPLPTIPTFTPTFDVSTILTVTPAGKAECPKENSSLIPDFQIDYYSSEADQKIPEFLNKGGSTSILVSRISKFIANIPINS
ncbi:MAG: hypothetical protein U0X87_14895 [Anaerolineales bacterium]